MCLPQLWSPNLGRSHLLKSTASATCIGIFKGVMVLTNLSNSIVNCHMLLFLEKEAYRVYLVCMYSEDFCSEFLLVIFVELHLKIWRFFWALKCERIWLLMPLKGWIPYNCCRLDKDLVVFVAVISELCLCRYRVLCRCRIRYSGVCKTCFYCVLPCQTLLSNWRRGFAWIICCWISAGFAVLTVRH